MDAAGAATTTGTMTDHVARLYAVALAICVFSLTWATVAARPWAHEESDPRVVALERREAKLRRQSVRVQRRVERRFAAYRVQLRERQRLVAAVTASNAAAAVVPVSSAAPAAPAASAPSPVVSVVSAPPVTATRSS